ncbi:MAG: phosphoglucosamine mutase [Planctomycetota bacterium]|nr:phosphoglucosamine mutase [Planctomycetota bacterium]
MVFGTDGVRDRAGKGYLAPESVRRLVQAIAGVLRQPELFPHEFPPIRGDTVYIGRDTRRSGEDLLAQVSEEFRRQGFPVADLGVLPTGGVAYTASVAADCCLAVVLSASHNPATYNGVKLLSPTGAKVPVAFEEMISDRYHRPAPSTASAGTEAPRIDLAGTAVREYVEFLVGCCRYPERLRGRRLALDTAHGAAYRVAPEVFQALGMELETLGNSPSGKNINEGCGSLHPEKLARVVRSSGACLGFCFDGDADRMIPVCASGQILDGDHSLALAGRYYYREGKLPKRAVVATVMSNLGLEKALDLDGLRLVRTPVGDRCVYECLERECHPLGGEQSGHLIFMDALRTGDGILAAIRLLDSLQSDSLDLDAEAAIVKKYPQILRNVRIREKTPFEQLPAVAEVVRRAEESLGTEGRVLLRFSGTEPLARVMLEGPDQKTIDRLCDKICRSIEDSLPA